MDFKSIVPAISRGAGIIVLTFWMRSPRLREDQGLTVSRAASWGAELERGL